MSRTAFLLLATALFAAEAVAAVQHSVGIARDQNSDAIRYIEHHQYLENGQHLVRYYDTENNILLEKEMRYPGLPQHPVLQQQDYLTDTEISIQRNDDMATMTRSSGEEDLAEFSFPLTEDTVIDAGFDAYIQDNWDAFDTLQTHRVKFAVAGQTRLIDMKISRVGEQQGLTVFTVEPANWLVRLLVPDMTLYYDDTARLARYEGFSNLKPTQDGSRQVVIKFQHFTLDEFLPAPLDEWLPIASSD